MPEPIEYADPVPFEEAQRMAAEHNARAMQAINKQEKEPASEDPYGIVSVFAAHLELSLTSMSPPEAFEAAQHATRHHLRSYHFLMFSHKGSQDVEYRMVRKRSSASSARSATEGIQSKPRRGGDAIGNAR